MDNLSRDVKRAAQLGYGVHYGRYKAEHPFAKGHLEDTVPEQKHQTRICKECGKEFIPHRKNQCFCEEKCRVKYHNRKAARKSARKQKKGPYLEIGPASCPICGAAFVRTSKDRRITFCGMSCAAQYRNMIKRETSSDGKS